MVKRVITQIQRA